MPIQFTCPSCGRELRAPDESAGATGPCPYCEAQITAPTAEGQPAIHQQPPPAAPEVPTGYAGYPGAIPPVVGQGVGLQATGRLDVGSVVSESWRILMANPGPIIGGYLLSSVIVGAVASGIPMAVQFGLLYLMGGGFPPNPNHPPPGPASWVPQVAGTTLQAIFTIALLPLSMGPYYVIDQVMTRGRADIQVIFRGFRSYWSIVGSTLLVGLATVVGLLGCIVGAFFVGAALCLALPEIIDRGAGAVDAIQTSWETTAGYRLQLVLLQLVLGLLSASGLLACCIGIYVTAPLFMVGLMVIYRELRGMRGLMV